MGGAVQNRSCILHVDMDAFYAAVELLDHPELRGKPLVIGAPPDKRGVVSTASYEARKYGIHSAMPSRTAARLCPHAVFLPVRMRRYLEVSQRVMDVIESFTPLVEQVSVDEAFLDVSGAMRRWKTSQAVATALKKRIRDDVQLTASVGVATNKFLAKLASDLEKPDGLTVVPEEPAAIAAFLAPLPVSKIWGVGKVTEARLRQCGLRTFRDVQRADPRALSSYVGASLAQHIAALAVGRDDRSVVTDSEAKSLSSETTFDEDCSDAQVIRQTMIEMAEHVGYRLRKDGTRARVGHIKVRYEDFSTITRQRALPRATSSDRALLGCALALLERERIARPVRLIGFGVSGLGEEEERQLELGPFTSDPGKLERLEIAVDELRHRFGRSALRRGSTLNAVDRGHGSR